MKAASLLEVFINKGDLNLVYTSRMFNPDGNQFDDSYLFVGPSVNKRKELMEFPLSELEGHKIIYISLGTINNNFSGFYQMCIQAFAETEYKVVMSVGTKCNITELGQIPDNFIVKQFVPQLEILKKSHIFISHSGFNSVSESLYYGVPLIVLPMVNDQYMVATRVTQLGAGIMLKMSEITDRQLIEAVEKIEFNDEYKTACERIGKSFRQADGCTNTVVKIKDYVRKWNGN
jgi:MGT family glycosyltransferase